jgi:hypothetical protein
MFRELCEETLGFVRGFCGAEFGIQVATAILSMCIGLVASSAGTFVLYLFS